MINPVKWSNSCTNGNVYNITSFSSRAPTATARDRQKEGLPCRAPTTPKPRRGNGQGGQLPRNSAELNGQASDELYPKQINLSCTARVSSEQSQIITLDIISHIILIKCNPVHVRNLPTQHHSWQLPQDTTINQMATQRLWAKTGSGKSECLCRYRVSHP